MESDDFPTLLGKVRLGDADAATAIVRSCQDALQRQVRMHLTNPRLRRVLDSVDVCQSVLGNFFFRLALGEIDLQSPAQLMALLNTMAHHRIHNLTRDHQAHRRDNRRLHPAGQEMLQALADPSPSPERQALAHDLLRNALALLTPEERYLALQRAAGRSWADLAEELGEEIDTLRKRLKRAVDRVARQLGLEVDPDD